VSVIALAVFLTLSVIAVLHALWGLGLRWPAQDERSLVALVIGATGRSRMPSLVRCLIVAAAIFAAGVVALLLTKLIAVPLPPILVSVTGVLVTLIFAGRGAAAYLPAWRGRFSQQPFAHFDRIFYGPLCLLLGFAFALLTIS
jgi:hypothetical protein